MPFYHQLGRVPPKRHTAYRQASGELYHEHLMGSIGFSGLSSLLYHLRPPTRVLDTRTVKELSWESDEDQTLRMRHFQLGDLPNSTSAVLDRTPLLFNRDVALSIVRPTGSDEFFYRNGQGDEVVYVAEGDGVLESQMGELEYRQGDYVVIPRGILHRFRPGAHSRVWSPAKACSCGPRTAPRGCRRSNYGSPISRQRLHSARPDNAARQRGFSRPSSTA